MSINMSARTGQRLDTDSDGPCCQPGEPIPHDDAARVAELFAALADPVRLQILSMIATAPEGEVCACDFVGPIERSQPTVSHHLKVLAAAGVVATERRGRWIWYRLAADTRETIVGAFGDVVG